MNSLYSNLPGEDFIQLLSQTFDHPNNNNIEQFRYIEHLLKQSLLTLRGNVLDPDKNHYLNVIYASKKKPDLFAQGELFEVSNDQDNNSEW